VSRHRAASLLPPRRVLRIVGCLLSKIHAIWCLFRWYRRCWIGQESSCTPAQVSASSTGEAPDQDSTQYELVHGRSHVCSPRCI
jgi:hypothetical protein